MSIEIKNVTKIYGEQKALDDISFELKNGEVVGFLGPNGAGKSTTMKIITGYIPATCGDVKVENMDIHDKPLAAKRSIGYLPESNPLYYDMYIREYLEFIRNIDKDLNIPKSRIEEVIGLTGLEKESTKKLGQLSKGYKQRVGLARAILHDPPVLILDEPTSGLDPNQILEIRDLIKQLGKSKTVLLSSHIMQEVKAICQRVIIINDGKIIANAPIEELDSPDEDQIYKVLFSKPIDEFPLEDLWKAKVEFINPLEVKIYAKKSEDLAARVQRWAADNNVLIEKWENESADLEYIFRKLTN